VGLDEYSVELVESGNVAILDRAHPYSEQPKEEGIVPIATTSSWTVFSCRWGKSAITRVIRRDEWECEADDQESRHCNDRYSR